MNSMTTLPRVFVSLFCLSLLGGSLLAADVKPAAAEAKTALPRLVDLGADKCIPCKLMTPVLEALAKEYAGQLDIVFIDVWKNRDAGSRYGIQVIPTQIFFAANGKELFRHEGFFAKKDILKKWAELGVALTPPKQKS